MRNVLLTAITAGIVFLSGVAMVSKKTTLKNNKKNYIDQEVNLAETQAANDIKKHTTEVRKSMPSKIASLKDRLATETVKKDTKGKVAIKEKQTLKSKLLITKERLLIAMKHLVAYSRQALNPLWNANLLDTRLLHTPLHKRMQPVLVVHQGTDSGYLPIGERKFQVIPGGKLLEQPTNHKKCLHKIREPSNQNNLYDLREFTIYKGG